MSEYMKLLEEQMKQASGMRLEQLKKHGEGEKKLVDDILLPVLKSTKGIILEKEIVTLTGVKAYIDAYYEPLRFGFEGEGFVSHAENITRPRFDFEKGRVRTMVAYGIPYIPFTWDDMDKRPDMCRRTLYEIFGRYSGSFTDSYREVSLYEREVIRYGLRLGHPIRMKDVRECLQMGQDHCRKVLRKMIVKKIIRPMNDQAKRNHEYILEDDAIKYLW